MKKFYFLALLCICNVAAFSQSATVVLWATTSGSATASALTADAIITGNTNTTRGYAVFDLSSIPAGSIIMSVSSGIDVSAYTPGAPPAPTIWDVYGISGDLSTISSPPSLFADLALPGGLIFYTIPWGTSPGDPLFPTNAPTVGFVQSILTVGSITLSYLTIMPPVPPPPAAPTTATYTITGFTGINGTPADTLVPGHAPYLVITYCPPPTGVTATGPSATLCAGSPLTLTGTAVGATNYSWTGPGAFTSTNESTTFFTGGAATGIYTLTAYNVCGPTTTDSAVATTALITVDGGPISGITNVWVGFTTILGNPTPGGTWVSSNPAIATVNGSGVVTGVAPGTVTITYTTVSGCVYTTSVLVNAYTTTSIPTVVDGNFDLQAWYPFCGDTSDRTQVVGAGPNPLFNIGAGDVPAVLTTDRFGVIDDAYQFIGTNVMYTFTFFPLDNSTGDDYTLSAWFEADTVQNSIIAYNGTPSSDGFGFVLNNGVTPNATGPGNYAAVMFGGVGQFLPTQVSLNRWHNLMLKKDGNSYNFFIDDVSVGFFISPFNAMGSGGTFQVGGDATSIPAVGPPGTPGPLQLGFLGKIDDVALYDAELSDIQRDSLYNYNPDANPFTLGNDTTICSDSITLAPNPQSSGDYYLWTYNGTLGIDTVFFYGTSVPDSDSIVTVSPAPGVTGTTYTLEVGKPFGCYDYNSVTVFKNPIPVNIGPLSVNICIGDTITLTDLLPHGAASSFVWSTGDTANSIRVSLAGTYSVTIDSIDHYTRTIGGVTYTDSVTCVGGATVTVNTFPAPIIAVPPAYTNCQGRPDTIRPYFDSAYTYTWGQGLGTPPLYSTSVDSLIDNTVGTNVYWLEVTNGGCSKYDTISVFIAFDTLTFYGHDTAICLGQSLEPSLALGNELVTDDTLATYQWTPTAGIPNSDEPNPRITPDTSAEYILTVSYPHCPNIVDSFYLDVQPNPTVFAGNNRSVCQYDTIHVAAVVTPSWYTHYSYAWTPATELLDSTTSTVVFTPVVADTVNLVVTVSTPAGCSYADSLLLFVHPGRYLLDSLARTVCPGDSVQLTPYIDSNFLPGTSIASYSWYPSTYLSQYTKYIKYTTTTTDSVYYLYDDTLSAPFAMPVTSTSYRLITASQYGCADTINYQITVPAAAVINLGPDSVTIFPGESYLINTQTNCVNFVWNPPLQIDNIYGESPTVTPLGSITYTVNASTEAGCRTVDSIKIKISPKSTIDLPNAFTPGAGSNSQFLVLTTGEVSLLYFRIYNRWGNLVFETKNIAQGWDGTYNGKPQPQDVYIYEIEAETIQGEVIQRQGNVTLLR